VRHEFGASLVGSNKFGKEVGRAGLRGREDGFTLFLGFFLALEFRQPFRHAGSGKLGDREGRVDETPIGELEVDGVLQEELVEKGDLADLTG
jgi:hypothetical protein